MPKFKFTVGTHEQIVVADSEAQARRTVKRLIGETPIDSVVEV